MIRVSRVVSLLRNRRPVQRFDETRQVPADALETILEAGRYAPSAREAQPWRLVVVQEALARHRIAAAAFNHPHVKTAPVVIVACARIHSHVSGTGRPSFPMDLAAVVQTLALTAADLGLHASWIFGFRESQVRQVLGIPEDVPVVMLLALGYPDRLARLAERRSHDEVIAWDRWHQSDSRGPGR